MKRINYGEVSYLVGDAVADLLVRYTAVLSTKSDADAIEINVLGPDGNPEVATFALGPGILMAAETTRSELDEPDNAEIVGYMEERLRRFAAGTHDHIVEEMVDGFDLHFGNESTWRDDR